LPSGQSPILVTSRADDALDKYVRIDAGLRPEVGEAGYSGKHVIAGVDQVLREVRLRGFPVTVRPCSSVQSNKSDATPRSVRGNRKRREERG
jgi:hypothetical protein